MQMRLFALVSLMAVSSLAMDDIAPYWCSPVCQDFIALRNQCEDSRNCFEGGYNENTYSCLEPCWEIAAPCLQACRDNIYILLRTCDARCSTYGECMEDCFAEEFQAYKPELP
ncbi:cysteine-rich neurotrophic factor [Aplysia californica]|uniref:Cysteine-rich neurotrophic factor n=1 Tax=Aplysia californica TaxID=6500 RepID=A0ABM1AG41_APLCA|nr:cysteine-rich neurotrophic factor [Aplysia californica]